MRTGRRASPHCLILTLRLLFDCPFGGKAVFQREDAGCRSAGTVRTWEDADHTCADTVCPREGAACTGACVIFCR